METVQIRLTLNDNSVVMQLKTVQTSNGVKL